MKWKWCPLFLFRVSPEAQLERRAQREIREIGVRLSERAGKKQKVDVEIKKAVIKEML